MFVELKEKFVKMFQSWSTRNLSIGVKEVFLKAIMQAIHSYSIQCF